MQKQSITKIFLSGCGYMQKHDISLLLSGNPYPGRGIVLGRSRDNSKAILAYFIMGRSENSRNRVFIETEDGIKTQAHDPQKMTDPALVIYHPVRRLKIHNETIYIVTNGDQTDTLRDYLSDGKSYVDALLTRTYEPDPPNYTPRISGLLIPCGSYMLSILKTLDATPCCCIRHYFTYDAPQPGIGHIIHTYTGDGAPLPSFEGEPICVAIDCGYRELADKIWDAMDKENKVALYVCEIDIETGNYESIIINKLQEN